MDNVPKYLLSWVRYPKEIELPIAMSPWIIEGKFLRPLDFKAAGNTRLVGTVATLNLMDTEKNDGKLVIIRIFFTVFLANYILRIDY